MTEVLTEPRNSKGTQKGGIKAVNQMLISTHGGKGRREAEKQIKHSRLQKHN